MAVHQIYAGTSEQRMRLAQGHMGVSVHPIGDPGEEMDTLAIVSRREVLAGRPDTLFIVTGMRHRPPPNFTAVCASVIRDTKDELAVAYVAPDHNPDHEPATMLCADTMICATAQLVATCDAGSDIAASIEQGGRRLRATFIEASEALHSGGLGTYVSQIARRCSVHNHLSTAPDAHAAHPDILDSNEVVSGSTFPSAYDHKNCASADAKCIAREAERDYRMWKLVMGSSGTLAVCVVALCVLLRK